MDNDYYVRTCELVTWYDAEKIQMLLKKHGISSVMMEMMQGPDTERNYVKKLKGGIDL